MMNITDSSSRADESSRAFFTTKLHICMTFMNDNSHDYSLFDMYLVSNYMNNQLIYYFITDAIFTADQAEF